jgi:hypothetical protein
LKAEHLIINLWLQTPTLDNCDEKYDNSGNEDQMITPYCFENMLMFVGKQVAAYELSFQQLLICV